MTSVYSTISGCEYSWMIYNKEGWIPEPCAQVDLTNGLKELFQYTVINSLPTNDAF